MRRRSTSRSGTVTPAASAGFFGFEARSPLPAFAASTLALSASSRSTAGAFGASGSLGGGSSHALQLRLEQRPKVAPVGARQSRRLELAVEAVDDLVGERELGRLDLGRLHRLGDLCVGVDVLGEVQGLEHERVAAGADEAERLAPGAHEPAEGARARLPHRLEEEPVRPALRGRRPGTRK